MLISLLLASLQLSSATPTQHVIVYAKDDSVTFESPASVPEPQDPTKAAFLRCFKADLLKPASFETPIPVAEFPVWGRLVPGAQGMIQFHASFPGGFVSKVALEGLLPNHLYILTLNGNPERSGNGNLPSPVPGNEQEKFLDFQTITTDSDGKYLATYAIALPKGSYDLRFYVKDTVDFKIVLYHDFFKFAVSEAETSALDINLKRTKRLTQNFADRYHSFPDLAASPERCAPPKRRTAREGSNRQFRFNG